MSGWTNPLLALRLVALIVREVLGFDRGGPRSRPLQSARITHYGPKGK